MTFSSIEFSLNLKIYILVPAPAQCNLQQTYQNLKSVFVYRKVCRGTEKITQQVLGTETRLVFFPLNIYQKVSFIQTPNNQTMTDKPGRTDDIRAASPHIQISIGMCVLYGHMDVCTPTSIYIYIYPDHYGVW